MLLSVGLNTGSVNLLKQRGLSDGQVNDFSALLNKANAQLDESKSAKQVLSGLNAGELALLQQGASLANPINLSNVSEEGAMNLLAQPDRSAMVDLNNDGLVEIGEAKSIVFPPVNAPDNVQVAWDQATENMSEGEKLTMEAHMHVLTYGLKMDGGPEKPQMSPEQQWSTAGWQELIGYGRGALEYAVSREGWTSSNLSKRDFFDRFENALSR